MVSANDELILQNVAWNVFGGSAVQLSSNIILKMENKVKLVVMK